ncbi:MAG: helix-turn-helix domain-containing protein [Planctomycetes bacterium]|nr:helix-turn-helix domain-containing protein [Planctomycetota bacterium]
MDEAAELLGVSIKTFNKVLHNEDMPARKIGREWKFSRRALIDWVGNGRSRDFYKDSGDTRDEDTNDVELTPRARNGEGIRTAQTEKPRARRTAGWQIED